MENAAAVDVELPNPELHPVTAPAHPGDAVEKMP